MSVQVSALEAQIIGILKDWYPITVAELQDELSLRRDTLDRALKALIVKGVIALEPLEDKTYIRLLVPGIEVVVPGRKKKRSSRSRPQPLDEDSFMYG
jgi:DNA-binding MarR family transcriptional regulator